MKRTWTKIMQKTNANKRFATFLTMIKYKKHIVNREKTSEKLDQFLRSLVKSLKIKFLYPIKGSMRMLSFKMINLRGLKKDISLTSNHEDFSSRQHSEAVARGVLKKICP